MENLSKLEIKYNVEMDKEKMMKCANCKTLVNIDKFDSYKQYVSTKESMNKNVSNGYFKIAKWSQLETIYECNECHTKWALAAPDFPVMGYFVQQ